MNAVNAIVVPNGKSTTRPLYQWDYGQRLTLLGYELPDSYEVHFSNTEDGTATIQIGDSTGVDIPDTYLTTGTDVWAWLYLHTGESDGETKATIRIPVRKRAQPTGGSPTPAQQDTITQAIALLNTAVEETSADAERAHADAERAETAAENLEGVVRYTEQTLTDAQKAQARTNIGVGDTRYIVRFLKTYDASILGYTYTTDKTVKGIFQAAVAGKGIWATVDDGSPQYQADSYPLEFYWNYRVMSNFTTVIRFSKTYMAQNETVKVESLTGEYVEKYDGTLVKADEWTMRTAQLATAQ